MPPCSRCYQSIMALDRLKFVCPACSFIQYQHAPLRNFDPTATTWWEYEYNGRLSDIQPAEMNYLMDEAEAYLPIGTYYEIRFKVPAKYGMVKYLYWLYEPVMANYLGILPSPIQVLGGIGDYIVGGFFAHMSRPPSLMQGMAALNGCDFPPPAPRADKGDCQCSHSHYDHIGFRGHLEGEARLRTSCRIVHCGCANYT